MSERDDLEREVYYPIHRPAYQCTGYDADDNLYTYTEETTMTNYAIDDEHSNQITCGLQEHKARETAQRIANERGKPVWLYADESDSESEQIDPEIDVELESAVGPRIIYPANCDGDLVDAAAPDGWEVDWDTTPADYGMRHKSSPLRRVATEAE